MAKRPNIPLDDDDDILAAKIAAAAHQGGIPSLTPPTPPQPTTTPSTNRKPIKLEVSPPLFEALTVAAARRGVTKRFLILETLRAAGFPVDDTDLHEDGRRLRGRNNMGH